VTVGGDVAPTTPGGWIVNATECLTVVPLVAASLSLFTSGLTAVHVQRSEQRLRTHITTTTGDAPKEDT
jgi:hypothetical protein